MEQVEGIFRLSVDIDTLTFRLRSKILLGHFYM